MLEEVKSSDWINTIHIRINKLYIVYIFPRTETQNESNKDSLYTVWSRASYSEGVLTVKVDDTNIENLE